MFVCDSCGELCSEYDLPTYRENEYETGIGYCSCGGQYIKAKHCEICDEYFDGTYESVCEVCKEENATLENAIGYGDEDRGEDELNPFLLRLFSISEIEEILKREIEQSMSIRGTEYKKIAKDYLLNAEYYNEWLEGHKDEL